MKKAAPLQTLELAVSAPQVMSSRLVQLSSAGLSPSAADYHELYLMWAEKVTGFGESMMAMTFETLRFQQQLVVSTAGYWLTPWILPQAMAHSSAAHLPEASERILRKAMTPIHGKVLANARRLSQNRT